MTSDLPPALDQILPHVQGPGQYVGGEVGSIVKPAGSVSLRMALAFPDAYTVGMSHHGCRILYDVANRMDGVACERVFAPFPDMEAALREANLPLGTLETWTPLADCDVVGFSCSYELNATALLTILDLGGVRLGRTERGPGDPLVLAGGHVFNPEPLSDFVDAFFIGDGEKALPALLSRVRAAGGRGCTDRRALLERLAAEVEGTYAPALYETRTNAQGFVVVDAPRGGAPWPVERCLVHDLEAAPAPTAPVVPVHETVHERVVLEVMRGCPNGCRFCLAGCTYRPVRVRSVETLLAQAEATYEATGYDEIGLLSLSTGDYPHLDELVEKLEARFAPIGVSLSLPSLRVDQALGSLPQRFKSVRKSGLTFAPEAGSDRLRAVVNKFGTNDELLAAAAEAYRQGWRTIKLYFMVGLPTETDEDEDAIAELANAVAGLRKKGGRKPAVTLSVSHFVPKPHTPFQWEAMEPPADLARKRERVEGKLWKKRVRLRPTDVAVSFLEGVLARGDRRVGAAIRRAWERGARLDGWSDHFRPDLWEQAFADCGLAPEAYACVPRHEAEPHPWSHVDIGVREAFLQRERTRGLAAERTPPCSPESCAGCGLASVCAFRAERDAGA